MKPLVFFGLLFTFISEFVSLKLDNALIEARSGKLMFVPEYPSDLIETKTFKKFMETVENNKLNVTVFASTANKWKNGNIKELFTLAISLPVNDVNLKKMTISIEDCVELLKTASQDKLSAECKAYQAIGKKSKGSNNLPGIVDSMMFFLMDKIYSYGDDFNYLFDSYAAMHTIHTKDKDDKNQTVKVYDAGFKFNDVNTHDVSAEEKKTIRKAISMGAAIYGRTDIPKVISKILDKELPDFKWQVAIYDEGFDETEQFVDSEKYYITQLTDRTYVVFT